MWKGVPPIVMAVPHFTSKAHTSDNQYPHLSSAAGYLHIPAQAVFPFLLLFLPEPPAAAVHHDNLHHLSDNGVAVVLEFPGSTFEDTSTATCVVVLKKNRLRIGNS